MAGVSSFRDRALRSAQYAVLALSAAGAVVAGYRMLTAPAIWNDEPLAWAKVVCVAAVVMAIAVLRWPRHAAVAAALACLVIAATLLTPAPVAAVALLLSAAMLAGQAVIGRSEDAAQGSAAVAVLVGTSLWIGVFALTSRLPIHYPQLHAAIALLAIVVWRHRARDLVARTCIAVWTARPTTATERAWIAIAGVVAIVHIVVAARPEVGYDASTMHLHFAELVAADRRFRYGVDRYLWAMMPLGVDYAYATAYLLGGEPGARTLNLAFAAVAGALVYRLGTVIATREAALACATLFAAMPVAMLVTGSLFSESLWVAMLLAALLVVIEGSRRRARFVPVFAILAGGAMATKVMSVFWLAVLVPAALWIAYRARSMTPIRGRDALFGAIGLAIGAWPYAAAWISTGNPVFPFMNGLFGSPLYEPVSFNNPAYNAALRPWTPWEVVLHSGSFIEGRDGAMGLAWLFAFPLVLLSMTRRQSSAFHLMAGIAVIFFVAIYLNQSYLRYLLPAFALIAVLASAPLADLLATRRTRVALLVVGIALVAFDVRAIASAHHPHATACIACLYDARARARYVETYAPLRAVASRLNRELRDARVGFLLPNEAGPAGYVGISRSANWHDDAFFRGLVRAPTTDAVRALVHQHGLTHVVYRATADPEYPAIREFATRHATALWSIGDYTVAALQPASGG